MPFRFLLLWALGHLAESPPSPRSQFLDSPELQVQKAVPEPAPLLWGCCTGRAPRPALPCPPAAFAEAARPRPEPLMVFPPSSTAPAWPPVPSGGNHRSLLRPLSLAPSASCPTRGLPCGLVAEPFSCSP